MKLKLKLDKDSLREFFLENAEKFVFGLVALAALMMIFQALTHKGYEKTPQQLLDKSRDADNKVDHTPPEVPPECHSMEFEKLVRRILLPIDETAYEYKNPWDVPVANPLRPRPQPQLYAAAKLHGAAGAGKFVAKAGNAAGGGERGTHYVALTGLVPIEQQTAAFLDAFEGVHLQRPQVDDAPQYRDFKVERAEVPPSGQNQELSWEDMTATINQAMAGWQMSDTEVVEPKYLVGNTAVVASTRRPTAVKSRNPLALPLPKTNHDWGELAAHDPEIPLAQKAAPKHKAPEQPAGGPPGADPGAESPPDEPLPEAPPEEEINKPPKYALLRLFDFTVKPGVSYRYRVSLVLRNPNYGEPVIYLANPKFAKPQYLQTPGSEPSNVISVPEDVRVLVKSVSPAKSPLGEPEGTVVMLDWQEDSGEMAHQEFPGKEQPPVRIVRGKVLNFPKTLFEVKSPPAATAATKPRHGKITTHTQRVPTKEITCLLGAVVVDMTGEGASGQLLLLDRLGNLVLHNAAEDMEAYRAWEAEENKATTTMPGTRGIRPRTPATPGGLDALSQPGKAAAKNNKSKP